MKYYIQQIDNGPTIKSTYTGETLYFDSKEKAKNHLELSYKNNNNPHPSWFEIKEDSNKKGLI